MDTLAREAAPYQLHPYGAVPGVRKGARWRRDSLPGSPLPAALLEARMQGVHAHRGRLWSERDEETLNDVKAHCWGLPEVCDRRIAIPQWLTSTIENADTGEIVDVGNNPRKRIMLAILWLAFEAGTFGVLMTGVQWAQVLCCGKRSITNYLADLTKRGLIRYTQTWRGLASRKGGDAWGAEEGPILLRIGPAFDAIALAAFARRHVQAPRGAVSRTHARRLAVALRNGARDRGRAIQLAHKDKRDASRLAGVDASRSTSVDASRGSEDDASRAAARDASRSPAVDASPLQRDDATGALRPTDDDPQTLAVVEEGCTGARLLPTAGPSSSRPSPRRDDQPAATSTSIADDASGSSRCDASARSSRDTSSTGAPTLGSAPSTPQPCNASQGRVGPRAKGMGWKKLPSSPLPPCGRKLRETPGAAPPGAPQGMNASGGRILRPTVAEARPEGDDTPPTLERPTSPRGGFEHCEPRANSDRPPEPSPTSESVPRSVRDDAVAELRRGLALLGPDSPFAAEALARLDAIERRRR